MGSLDDFLKELHATREKSKYQKADGKHDRGLSKCVGCVMQRKPCSGGPHCSLCFDRGTSCIFVPLAERAKVMEEGIGLTPTTPASLRGPKHLKKKAEVEQGKQGVDEKGLKRKAEDEQGDEGGDESQEDGAKGKGAKAKRQKMEKGKGRAK